MGSNPTSFAYDSGNGYIFVLNCGSNNVSVLLLQKSGKNSLSNASIYEIFRVAAASAIIAGVAVMLMKRRK